MNELLEDSLTHLHEKGGRHLNLTQQDVSIADYYAGRQQILQNQASEITQAVKDIQAKYQVELWQLEQEYGVYISMITPAGEE
jgi:hypothetical protein